MAARGTIGRGGTGCLAARGTIGRGRRAARLPELMAFALAALLSIAGCGRDAAVQPPAGGSLSVRVVTAPRSPAAPVIGAVDSLRVYLRGAGNELLVHPALIAIAPGQTRFDVALEAVPGRGRSITVLALGHRPVSGGAGTEPVTGRGILFAGRATGIDITAGRIPTVNVTLGLFVPEFNEPLTTRGSTAHTVSWTEIPTADRYLLTVVTSRGAETVTLLEPKYAGTQLPAVYLVRAVEFSGIAGAPSDSLRVIGQVPNIPVLSVEGTSPGRIDLAWTNVGENLDGYELQRGQSPVFEFLPLVTLSGTTVRHSDRTVEPDVDYTYRVRALSPAGPSPWSNLVNASAPLPPPGAPVNLAARLVNPSTIDLTWEAGTGGATNYDVERRPAGGGFQLIATPPGDARTYRDAGLPDGVVWEYRVRATSSGGVSAFSGTASAATPLTAPDGFTAVPVSPTRVDLAWNDNSVSETGYEVQRRSVSSGGFQPLVSLPANVKQFGDITVTENATFSYRVRAVNGAMVSAWSEERTVNTPLAPPGAPQNLTAQAIGPTRVDLAWSPGSGVVVSYAIERRVPPAAFTALATAPAQATGFTDTGVTGSTGYEYRVRAVNSAGNSPYSNTAAVTTPLAPPAAPTNLVVTGIQRTQVDIAWSDNATNEANYQVERATATSGFVLVATLPANTTTYASTNLAAVTQYSFRVRAVNAAGNSAYSNTVQATTLPPPPTAPTQVNADGLSTTIGVYWVDTSNNEDGFRIERRVNNGPYIEIGTSGPDTQVYEDRNPVCSGTHIYRVRAYNTGGNSQYSADSNAILWECGTLSRTGQ